MCQHKIMRGQGGGLRVHMLWSTPPPFPLPASDFALEPSSNRQGVAFYQGQNQPGLVQESSPEISGLKVRGSSIHISYAWIYGHLLVQRLCPSSLSTHSE